MVCHDVDPRSDNPPRHSVITYRLIVRGPGVNNYYRLTRTYKHRSHQSTK